MFADDSAFGEIILIIIIAFVIVIIFKVTSLFASVYSENMINISPSTQKNENATWGRNSCNYLMGDTLSSVLRDHNINKSDNNSADILIPCGYDEINNEINQMDPNQNQKVFIIHDADNLAAKDYLWKALVDHQGLQKAKILMPNTYILYSPTDLSRLKNEYNSKKLYIMKKNIQRQEGLKITNSYDEILKSASEYVIVQELLQDPYLIKDKKINLRLYVLVVCNKSNIDIYVYNDGFMYYTKEPFRRGTTDPGPNITTGYIEREVYAENPLTHQDFRIYLDNPNRPLTDPETKVRQQNLMISNVVFNRINDLLREVFISCVKNLCNGDKLKNIVSFQMFGADIALSDNLTPTMMEINKGPDMDAKDERDGQIKKECTKDMLRLLRIIDEPGPNGFIKILDKENNKINKVY